MASARLAIAIPTYQRPDILIPHLEALLPVAERLSIPIHISDDSGDAETERRVRALSARYDNLHYRRNQPALRHDANLLESLLWPDADFVWLLGDALRIDPQCLEDIAARADDQDFLFVNSHSDALASRRIEDPAAIGEFVREMLWHQTLTGATIYHRRVCEWVRRSRAEGSERIVRNFPQLSVILGYLEARGADAPPGRIEWFGRRCLTSSHKTSYWADRAVEVFVSDWSALVTSFPGMIPPEQVGPVIKSHSKNTDFFSAERLLDLRQKGFVGPSSMTIPHFFDAMHLSRSRVAALLVLPPSLILAYRRLKRAVGRR